MNNRDRFKANDRWFNRAVGALTGFMVLSGLILGATVVLVMKKVSIILGIIVGLSGACVVVLIYFLIACILSHFVDIKLIRNKLYDIEDMNNNEEIKL